MRRATAASLLLAAIWAGPAADGALGHSGLLSSDPFSGATLGASPSEVRLTFSEEPEPSLSEIEVLDANGTPLQEGPPEPVANSPLALAVPVPKLPRGTYTVSFRAVSAIDGHATVGVYAFGVGVPPAGVSAEAPSGDDGTSLLELVARGALLLGLGLLLGASVAGLARFGGSSGNDLMLAAAGWFTAVLGLVLLTVVQRRAAGSSLGDLADTPVGEALLGRAIAIAIAGAGVVALFAGWRSDRVRRSALATMALGALGAIVVHVDAGHAAASGWSTTVTVGAQVTHFAAAGIWFGGLAALLVGTRGAPSKEKAAAVRRYAAVALGALIVVLATGTLRAVDELAAPGDLLSTGYGRAVLAKVVLIGLIAALAVRNRGRNLPLVRKDMEPLRRTSRAELGLAVAAVAVAAVLGSLAPAVDQPEAATAGVAASGSDLAGTVEVELEAVSDQPGPNTFTAVVENSDTGEPLDAERVSLLFTPLDDPGVKPTSLELKQSGDGEYTGTGSNLAFDGRWEVTAGIEAGGGAVEVPMELDLPIAPPIEGSLSVLRLPDQPVEYTLQVGDDGYIRMTVEPQEPGSNDVVVTLFSVFQNLAPTDQLVVTSRAGDGETTQQPVRRLAPARFAAEVELQAGENTVTVIAQTRASGRLRGEFELDVDEG